MYPDYRYQVDTRSTAWGATKMVHGIEHIIGLPVSDRPTEFIKATWMISMVKTMAYPGRGCKMSEC